MEIKLLSCPLCLKPHFHGVDSLRTTLISVATSELSCPVCSETFLGLDKLTIHLFIHINLEKTEEPNHEEKSKSEKEIDESINNLDKSLAGDQADPVKCDICYFTFTDQTILDMHQKLLHQTSPDKNTGLYSYHCHLCSKKFKKRGSLMVHLRVAHYGFGLNNDDQKSSSSQIPKAIEPVKAQDSNKQWECDVCAKMFTTKYFLKKHKRLHTGEMPYFCAQCNKSFTFQQSYHKHMLYHSSEKPYVCTECGRAFKELSTLQNHVRIHSGERPFGCETCGKRFRQRVSYLVHQRIHTGVMPYKCTACEKNFRYKVSQRSHKCPMDPPGTVVRVVAENDKEIPAESNNGANVKCIMSVDYNTGDINFTNIEGQKGSPLPQGSEAVHADKMYTQQIFADGFSQNEPSSALTDIQTELFSMVLSPILPDVESLCIDSSPLKNEKNEKVANGLDILNEQSLNELLYGKENK